MERGHGAMSGIGHGKEQRQYWRWYLPICLAPRLAWEFCAKPAGDAWGRNLRTGFAQAQTKPGNENEMSAARSSAVLLLLAQASSPRVHQQLLSSQMPLTFTKSQTTAMYEIAMGRIRMLSYFLASYSTWK